MRPVVVADHLMVLLVVMLQPYQVGRLELE
jgi:hypothetical protein